MNLKIKNKMKRIEKEYFFNKILKNLRIKNKIYFRFFLTIFAFKHFDKRNFKGILNKKLNRVLKTSEKIPANRNMSKKT